MNDWDSELDQILEQSEQAIRSREETDFYLGDPGDENDREREEEA